MAEGAWSCVPYAGVQLQCVWVLAHHVAAVERSVTAKGPRILCEDLGLLVGAGL